MFWSWHSDEGCPRPPAPLSLLDVNSDKDTKAKADKNKVVETEGEETASEDGSKPPFNPHQSGPTETHVVTEGEALDRIRYFNPS